MVKLCFAFVLALISESHFFLSDPLHPTSRCFNKPELGQFLTRQPLLRSNVSLLKRQYQMLRQRYAKLYKRQRKEKPKTARWWEIQQRLSKIQQRLIALEKKIFACGTRNSKLRLLVVNDSVLLLSPLLEEFNNVFTPLGGILPVKEVKIDVPYSSFQSTLFARGNRKESVRVIFKASFMDGEIKDPNIKRELLKTVRAPFPNNSSCTRTVKLRFTNKDFSSSGIIVAPDDDDSLTTDNWYGYWKCTGPHTFVLNVATAKNMYGNYKSTAWGPAHEDYTVTSKSKRSAGGTYMYYDLNPAHSILGRAGVWPGNFYASLRTNIIYLSRVDKTSGWTGYYTCQLCPPGSYCLD